MEKVMQPVLNKPGLMSVREFADLVNLSPTTVYAGAYADRFATSTETCRMKVCVADGLRWVETLSPKIRARQCGAKLWPLVHREAALKVVLQWFPAK